MTLFLALAAFCISVLGMVLLLTVPPRVPPLSSEEEWNQAVKNLKDQWASWKLNRDQDFLYHIGQVNQQHIQFREQLRNHISADHLHEDRGNGDDR